MSIVYVEIRFIIDNPNLRSFGRELQHQPYEIQAAFGATGGGPIEGRHPQYGSFALRGQSEVFASELGVAIDI